MARKVDHSFDQIGRRLRGKDLTAHERVLATDDAVRVRWLLAHFADGDSVVDVGASDGAIAHRIQRQTHCPVIAVERHRGHPAPRGLLWYAGEAEMILPALPCHSALCAEVLEHLTVTAGRALLAALSPDCQRLIVTVPNRRSQSYDNTKRSRWAYPDHVRTFTAKSLTRWLLSCGWQTDQVTPIVGTLNDSIWLGCVCARV
jgi:2-polyprenyl-3-methyl-5-hydroxy-6-metoxy-1,4-benzoquinol methylase